MAVEIILSDGTKGTVYGANLTSVVTTCEREAWIACEVGKHPKSVTFARTAQVVAIREEA